VTHPGPAELSAADRQQLQALVIEHAWLLDHDRWHGVADLYLEEGTLSVGPRVLQGRPALLGWADQRATNTGRRTHHQCTNIRFTSSGDDTADGYVMVVLHVSQHGGEPHIEFVGEYRDRYQRDADNQWRFRERRLQSLSEESAAQSAQPNGSL
jgi:3-phenylpropionate/cinnamic acid dioxygenase small subunit